MSDTWSERLSEYLDGDLTPSDAEALELHLEQCDSCRRSLAEIRSVVTRLAADPVAAADQPSSRAWAAIQGSLKTRRPRWIVPAALAAALAGVALVGGLLSRQPAPASPYIQASSDLEAILRENRGQLRPETLKALEQSMAQIDSAIAQAERALRADPGSEYVTRYVGQLHNTRLMALRQAVAIARQRG